MNMEDRYDRSGKWPIDASGWQIVNIGQLLFAEGPWGFKAVTPNNTFFFGYHEGETQDFYGPQTAVISYLGLKTTSIGDGYVLNTPEEIKSAKDNLSKYIVAHPKVFCSSPIQSIRFHDGPVQVREIF